MGTRIIIKGADFSKCAVSSEDLDLAFVGTSQSLWGHVNNQITDGKYGFKTPVGGFIKGFTIKAENPGNVKVVVYDDSGFISESGSVAVSVGTKTYNINNRILVRSGQYVGLSFDSYVCKYLNENIGDVQTYTFANTVITDEKKRIYPFNIIVF